MTMTNDTNYFAGLDFSGARGALANLWSAVGIEHDQKLHILSLRPHPFRPDAAAFLHAGWREAAGASPDATLLAGLDFPFGIPRAAAEQLGLLQAGYREILRHLAASDADHIAAALPEHRKTPRACDTFATGSAALAPLDIRLYKQTIEGARFLHELLAEGRTALLPQCPQPDAALTLIEVYPSVTARDVGIKAPRKPKAPGQVRGRPAALAHYLSFDHPAMLAAAVTLEDAWDAVLACLSAFLVRHDLEQPGRVATIPANLRATEGWIYRHPDAWSLPH